MSVSATPIRLWSSLTHMQDTYAYSSAGAPPRHRPTRGRRFLASDLRWAQRSMSPPAVPSPSAHGVVAAPNPAPRSPGVGSRASTSSSRWMLSSTTPMMGLAASVGDARSSALAFAGHRPLNDSPIAPYRSRFARAPPSSSSPAPLATATSGANLLLSKYSYFRPSVTLTSPLKYCSSSGSRMGITGSKNALAWVSLMSTSCAWVPYVTSQPFAGNRRTGWPAGEPLTSAAVHRTAFWRPAWGAGARVWTRGRPPVSTRALIL
mmetsp:Transcript_11215/g.46773  ORF Transcript_11215/g.46773 Transcript_11215/m.46773 type:complete len:263 (+) Transcript_11215:990-1778(+)